MLSNTTQMSVAGTSAWVMRAKASRIVDGITRPVHPRRPVPPEVRQAVPAARRVGAHGAARVGGDAGHAMPAQQTVRRCGEPAGMAWLAHDRALVERAHALEETAGHARVVFERRRQLHQQWPAFAAQPADFREKSLQQTSWPAQLLVVRDQPGHLDGKPKSRRRRRRPPGIGRVGVRPIEGAVRSPRTTTSCGVPLEVRASSREAVRGCARDGPPGSADANAWTTGCANPHVDIIGTFSRSVQMCTSVRPPDNVLPHTSAPRREKRRMRRQERWHAVTARVLHSTAIT